MPATTWCRPVLAAMPLRPTACRRTCDQCGAASTARPRGQARGAPAPDVLYPWMIEPRELRPSWSGAAAVEEYCWVCRLETEQEARESGKHVCLWCGEENSPLTSPEWD